MIFSCFYVPPVMAMSRKVHSKLISAARELHPPVTASVDNPPSAELATRSLASNPTQSSREDWSMFGAERPAGKSCRLSDPKVALGKAGEHKVDRVYTETVHVTLTIIGPKPAKVAMVRNPVCVTLKP